MTDDRRPSPTDSTASLTPADDGPAALPPASTSGPTSFAGRMPRKSESLRAGVIVGTGLVVALGAAVAMGASPAASGAPSASAATTVPAAGSGSDLHGGPGLMPGGPSADFGRGGPGKGDGRGFGQISVTAISGSSVSLATDDGWTRTITTTSATTITRGGVAATLADLAVGDEIHFHQARNADGTYTITAIEIVLPHAVGTVTAVGADTITITRRDGTSQTITTTGTTTYRTGKAAGTRADVKVGTVIVATGENASDGTLTATSVDVRLPHVQGTVTATTADTITITGRDGTTVTIHVSSGTTFQVPGVAAATLADVKAGMAIGVAGTARADGSIDATEVHAGKFGGRGHDGIDPDGTGPDASSAPDASTGTDG